MGRNAYGIELNPLAVLLAKVKSTPIKPDVLQKEYISLISNIKNCKSMRGERPQFFNIDFWFKENVIYELNKIKKSINNIKDKDVRDFFMVAFSETVRASSNTRYGEFKLFRIPQEKLKNHNPNAKK